MNSLQEPLVAVSILMITYNHEKFISEAIEGVFMQQTDFPFELIIANDASTDNTSTVINDFLKTHPRGNLIKYFKNDSNIGMTPNFIFALEQCQGKYIAICEGDDYWTDPNKLQIQVDFLEANGQAAGCFHHASFVSENGEIIQEIYHPEVSDFISYNQEKCLTVLKSSYATCSLVFKREVLKNVPESLLSNMCDEFLDLVITEKGLLHLLDFNGACYRFHRGGVWSGLSMVQSKITMYKRNAILYDIPSFKKKYGIYLKTRFFLVAKQFLFSISIRRKIRISFFFNVLQYLDYSKKETYNFITKFCKNVTGFKKIM